MTGEVEDGLNGLVDYYSGVVKSAGDYYPFGWQQPSRTYNSPAYRYGFNGKEKDENGEWGSQTNYDYGFRIYNPAIGKFLSVDPLAPEYPWYSPYHYAGNRPINAIDLDGAEPKDAYLARQQTRSVIKKISGGDVEKEKELWAAYGRGENAAIFTAGVVLATSADFYFTGGRFTYSYLSLNLADKTRNYVEVTSNPSASPEDIENAQHDLTTAEINYLGGIYGTSSTPRVNTTPKTKVKKDPLLQYADDMAQEGHSGAVTETILSDGTVIYTRSGGSTPKSDIITGELMHTGRTVKIPKNEQCFIGNCAEIGGMETAIGLDKSLKGATQRTVQLGKTKSSIQHGEHKPACTTCRNMQEKLEVIEKKPPVKTGG